MEPYVSDNYRERRKRWEGQYYGMSRLNFGVDPAQSGQVVASLVFCYNGGTT